MSMAILLTLLLGTTLGVVAQEEECESQECESLNLMQTQLEFRRQQSQVGAEAGPPVDCKAYCEKKQAKGEYTWDQLCTWSACSTCSACPTTTTTTTTTIYTPYCSGAFLLQKGVSSHESMAKKVDRENQAMMYHHSYCGKSKHLSGRRGASRSSQSGSASRRRKISRGDCAAFTSTRSPNGLENCDEDLNMPYAYAYHLHPTYDSESKNSAQELQDAFIANFNVQECEHVDESTTYSTKERLCLLSTVKGCNKEPPLAPEDVEAIFPLCQFGIYVRGGAMFDTTMGKDGTSPWQWMSLNKDCFGEPIDVLAHAVMCPSLAHGKWAFFVNGTHETTAATWITGANSVDGCYGQECQPAECEVAQDVLNGSAVYEALCCAVTAIEAIPTDLDQLMAKTYSNVLKFQSKGWWDVEDQSMKNPELAYTPVFPDTVFPGGTCHGECTELR